MCVTSLSASCNTIRRSKQLHFDPGKMAMMVRSGSATHPSNCTRLFCSKYPHSTRNIFLEKLKCVAQAQAHTTGILTCSNAQNQGCCSLILFSRLVFEPLHSNRISNTVRCAPPFRPSVSSVPIHATFLLLLRHLRCSQGFPPTNQRRHQRNRSLTRDILRYQEEHRRASLLRPFSTWFHLFQKLHDFSSCFFCQVQGNVRVEAVASHS